MLIETTYWQRSNLKISKRRRWSAPGGALGVGCDDEEDSGQQGRGVDCDGKGDKRAGRCLNR